MQNTEPIKTPPRYSLGKVVIEPSPVGYYTSYKAWTEINDLLTDARIENKLLRDFITRILGRPTAEIDAWIESRFFKRQVARTKAGINGQKKTLRKIK